MCFWKNITFEDYSNEAEEEFHKRFKRDMVKYKRHLAPNYGERQTQLFIGYKMFKATQRLVIATWVLVIITILLTLLLK